MFVKQVKLIEISFDHHVFGVGRKGFLVMSRTIDFPILVTPCVDVVFPYIVMIALDHLVAFWLLGFSEVYHSMVSPYRWTTKLGKTVHLDECDRL